MLSVLWRTAVLYLVLILSIRLTGKRQVGEMQLSELITAFLISEVAAVPLGDPDIPILAGIIPILLLVSLEIIISYLTTKSLLFKRMFESPPTVLISKGKLNRHALEKQRLTADELLSSLRLKDIGDISALEYCFLEHNGQISSFKKDDSLTMPVVIDGRINDHFLSILGRDRKWLTNTLSKMNKTPAECFLVSTDGKSLSVVLPKKIDKKHSGQKLSR